MIFLQCIFSINIENFSLTTTRRLGQLCSNTKSVRQLSFASPEFTKSFCNSLAFNSTLYQIISKRKITEKSVKLSGSSCDSLDFFALLHDSHARLEAHSLNFRGGLVYLLSLLLSDPLNVEHLLFGTKHI